MAKVKGPILSMSARGQIGKSQVYAAWRGIAYARQHVDPANPRTTAQTTTRNTFTFVDDAWKKMSALARAPWELAVVGRPLVARNMLMSTNIPALRGNADRSNWVGSPGALGGLAPVSVTAVAGAASGEIDVTVAAPPEPVDWTLDGVIASAMHDGDPETVLDEFIKEVEDAAPTPDADNIVTLTGLTAGDSYVVSAWLRWLRPDGTTAYGSSETVVQASTV